METKCGFVALAGSPNVGKSTLLNRLLGEEVAIVSPRPQTTWNVVRGILTREEGQIIFVDTPGIHRARDYVGLHMVKQARQAISEVDLLCWLVDCRQPPEENWDLFVRPRPAAPSFLLINKIDLFDRPALLPRIEEYSKLGLFREIIPLSALTGENVDRLSHLFWQYLPPSPLLFPPDQISDQPERDLVREFIREKVFQLTRQEIPYASAVKIDEFKEREDGEKIYIAATIYVERKTQKGILIGDKGAMIKKIGTAARRRIEGLLGRPVYLDLQVKIREGWRRDKTSLKEFGLD